MAYTTRRIGVVLFQLGGPDTLEAIEPFLFNLFCDPDIIDFPFARIGRKPLAKLISSTRARKVQHHYATIGGGSPIRRFTEQQARALQLKLTEAGLDARCFVAMRYWHPFTARAIEQLRDACCDEVVLLPLYPQYSSTTTGSSLNEWRRLFREDVPVQCVDAFYRHEMYLQALVEKIDEALARFAEPERPEIVFSAHSVPVAVIHKGDPYQRQIEETVERLMQRGGWTNGHPLLPEQSRSQQVAAALVAHRVARACDGKRPRGLHRAHFVCFGSRRDTGRDRSRGSRRSRQIGDQAVRDDVGFKRFADIHCGVGRFGSHGDGS